MGARKVTAAEPGKERKKREVSKLPEAIQQKLDNGVLVAKSAGKVYAILHPLSEHQRAEVLSMVGTI